MTAPQIIDRALTFNFGKSVSTVTGRADILDISIIPLNSASSGAAGATFAGGLKTLQIALTAASNPAIFHLIPSFAPGLTEPIKYRVLWREGLTARTYTYDFSMPDADLTWEALVAGTGNIIDGEIYLQQSDLGVPNRVARLNSSGIPVTSAGDPVATGADITAVANSINAEVVARQGAVAGVRATLEGELASQVAATLNTAEVYTNNAITSVSSDINTERSSRIGADADLQTQLDNDTDGLQDQIDSLVASTGGNTTALNSKADLDGSGHVPVAQIPTSILTNAVAVADQTAMLALSTMVAHKGTVAVRPDGVWVLNATDPTQLANWVSLTTVSSVNAKRGAVVLSATDVGAIPAGGAILMSQVTGLNTALSAKADTTALASVQTQVSAILADTTLVHTASGVIPTNLMSSDMVYLNSVGQLVKKNGDIIPITGGGGAVFSVNSKTGLVVLTASDVGAIDAAGLSTGLATKADLVSGTVPTAQIPSLAQSKITGLSTALGLKADLVSSLVPLAQIPVLPNTKITGLSTLIANNQLDVSSNAVNRIAALETAVAGGGGGGGGGTPSTTVFYTSSNTTTAVTDFTQVNPHSPWGIDADGTITGTIGTWYYLYTGVRSTDVAYPYISANGHLNLRRWNEAGAADPVYALASDVTALSTTVASKASASDLTALTATVATKAATTALTALSATVDTKAATADLNALSTTVSTKANQSALDTTNTTVGTKANQSDLTALTTTVAGKALNSDLTTLAGRVTTAEGALTSKADLVSGTVPLSQIASLPESKVTGLVADLAAKADLTAGKLATAQIPTNIPQSSVTGLGTALGTKADLVSGTVPMSQLPLAAIPNVAVVANRAALLALSSAVVQYGDLALITGTVDKNTYVLTGNDPSQFSNWTPLTTPDAPVISVNSQTGTVVLAASDVGALASNAAIPQSQVTGLVTALSTFATSTALTTGLAGKTSPTDVQNILSLSSFTKRADYVATAPVASLAGQQSADGVLMPTGAVVLLTAQASSVNNGLWVVGSGAWTRTADFATGSYLAKGSIVIISNTTAQPAGTGNPNTIWQASSSSGFVDTSVNNWTRIGWSAPPFAPVGGNGISVTGSTFTLNAVAGGGLQASGAGASVDPTVVARKFVGTVPSGSTVAGITHGLNTTRPQVTIWDTASGNMVLAGVTSTGVNSISIEFASAPASGQYAVCVVG